MSKEETPKYVPAQRYAGMQVIDSKGSLIGSVKDVSVDFKSRKLAFRVNTKNRNELDMDWEDVLSVEDVVLLKKEVALPSGVEQMTAAQPAGVSAPKIQAALICPNCGASAPGHAKFCPRCGSALR